MWGKERNTMDYETKEYDTGMLTFEDLHPGYEDEMEEMTKCAHLPYCNGYSAHDEECPKFEDNSTSYEAHV